MSTNVSAEKAATVWQRRSDKDSVSTRASTHSGTAVDTAITSNGHADENVKTGKKNTRRRGRRRSKKNQPHSKNADTHGRLNVAVEQGHATRVSVQGDNVLAVNGAQPTSDNQTVKSHTAEPSAHIKTNTKKRYDSRSTAHPGMRRGAIYSAIDLGTNNCRLLIAKPTKNGFRVIDAFSRIVRLGEGVGKDNRLSEDAMERTIEALKVCSEKLARRGVTCMRHVATEACRIADNSDEFVARVKRETGINLDVISAGEEARLAVLGCQSLIAPDKRNALVFDIGGGSTELIWVKVHSDGQTEIKGWVSVPWGVVNLTETFAQPDKVLKAESYTEMVTLVEGHLQKFNKVHQLNKVLKGRHTQFLGTSGTVTTLASLHLELPKYMRDKVDGAWMKASDIMSLSRRVAEMTPEERAAEPCIGEERSDLVVAGCAILEAILGMWKVPSLRVADRGIREGILRGLMQLDQPPLHARRHKHKPKTEYAAKVAIEKTNG